jgi:hypothetical protein
MEKQNGVDLGLKKPFTSVADIFWACVGASIG